MDKSSTTYKKVRNRSGFPIITVLALMAAALGSGMMVYGLVLELVYSADGVGAIVMGAFLGLAWFPGFFRSGIELDIAHRRFREYDGFRGSNKDQWIEIEEGDYLSIVGYSQGRGTRGLRASSFVHLAMSKVYFWSDDWHIEIFQGHYEDALQFAKTFGKETDLLINDINKDQHISGLSQGSNKGSW